jgi:hypothetical protein
MLTSQSKKRGFCFAHAACGGAPDSRPASALRNFKRYRVLERFALEIAA